MLGNLPVLDDMEMLKEENNKYTPLSPIIIGSAQDKLYYIKRITSFKIIQTEYKQRKEKNMTKFMRTYQTIQPMLDYSELAMHI
ncbi:unnamed protein product [Haemonchus placei]|uniref:Uncharacterized protein n=1 Tax=Haemonchus placei TaxID=6290 RepID=A0A0N4WJH9_HAEPC|nr:unnamed protein product [Haemonchus placei]